MRYRRAFTLMELLVAIGVTIMLAGLLLPVLARSRDSAHDTECRSNLRGMYAGWVAYMNVAGPRTPYTKHITLNPSWHDTLRVIFPETISVQAAALSPAGALPLRYTVCPASMSRYPDQRWWSHVWNYAANCWWANPEFLGGPPEYNELKLWDEIRHPSRYPWYLDGAIYGRPPASVAYIAPTPVIGPPDWGVGAHHRGGERFNTVFADGAVRSVPIGEMRAEAPVADQFDWFANR